MHLKVLGLGQAEAVPAGLDAKRAWAARRSRDQPWAHGKSETLEGKVVYGDGDLGKTKSASFTARNRRYDAGGKGKGGKTSSKVSLLSTALLLPTYRLMPAFTTRRCAHLPLRTLQAARALEALGCVIISVMLPIATLEQAAPNAVFEAYEVFMDAYNHLNPICGDARSPAAKSHAGTEGAALTHSLAHTTSRYSLPPLQERWSTVL